MFPVGEKFFSSWKPLIGVFYENRDFDGEKATDKCFAAHWNILTKVLEQLTMNDERWTVSVERLTNGRLEDANWDINP